ncbi:hypothetical protein ACLB2K_052442 [Fragaria x ananassa]
MRQADMRKLANRVQFGIPEENSLGDGLGEGYGMLGQAGSGKLRVSKGLSSRILTLMDSNLTVELRAPTSLKQEHFQKSRASERNWRRITLV